jgi:predicted dinucleotide-binding enzyme
MMRAEREHQQRGGTMQIGVLGTGMVGRAIAVRLAELGHQVTIGTRDPQATLARTESSPQGVGPISEWLAANPAVALRPFAAAVEAADVVVNATSGAAAQGVLTAAGAGNLVGKVLLDVSNPLDFSKGLPPSLLVANTDSLAEQIQRAYPETRVVKALNIVNANVMTRPAELAGGDHTMLVEGNDEAAKQVVRDLLAEFGWRDIIDLGDITAARGMEMYLPLWLRLMGALGTVSFSIKVVR